METNEIPPKLVIALRSDLLTWQKLNVTAFLVSGVAHSFPDVIGEPYVDGSGNQYLPMFGHPVMVYESDSEGLATALGRARSREVPTSVFTEELFATGNDIDNRAAVAAVETEKMNVVGFAFRADRKTADKVLKGFKLHS